MKAALQILASIACLMLASCSTTVEKMTKNGPQGDTYLWVQNQIGGKATWQNSMGSSFAGDFEKSLADVAQAAGFMYGAWTSLQQQLAKFSYEKLLAKEITQREFQKQLFQINKLGATVPNPNDGIIEVPLQ
jgi:hypothetical protein